MAAHQVEYVVKRHPIRGVIWGLILGLGVALYLVIFAVVAFGTLTPYVVTLVGGVAGGLWGMFAPPKKPKGLPPSEPRMAGQPEPEPGPEPDVDEAEGATEILVSDEVPED